MDRAGLSGRVAGRGLPAEGGRKDTLRFGNEALVIRLPTDVFTPGFNLLVQGISFTGGNERSSYLAFGGASSTGWARHPFRPPASKSRWALSSCSIDSLPPYGSPQQHSLPTSRRSCPECSGSPFAGSHDGLGGGYRLWAPVRCLERDASAGGRSGSRPPTPGIPTASAAPRYPRPTRPRFDRENIMVTYEVGPRFSVGVGRQNYVQDSADSKPAIRATGNTVFAGGVWYDTRLTAGLYDSHSEGISNLSSYFAVGRELARWLDAEVFVLQSRPRGLPVVTTPLANLRWRLSSRIGLSQQISFHNGHATVLFGASLMTPIGDFVADYQVVHQPLKPLTPFRSALTLTARLQLGKYSTSVGTYVQPDGSVDYSASGSTFLYMGSFGGAQPQQVGGRMARYVIRGVVRDEDGLGVEGAAVEIGGEVVFTNSSWRVLPPGGPPTARRLRC